MVKTFPKKLAAGDVILICEKGLKHAMDRFFQRTKKWHHVMLYIGKGKVLEVTPLKGCRISMLSLSRKRYKAVKVLRAAKLRFQAKKQLVQEAVKTFLGKRASVKAFLKLMLVRALPLVSELVSWLSLSKLSQRYKRYKCNTKDIVCSTLVSIAYYLHGKSVKMKIKPEYVLPKDFEAAEGFEVVFESAWDT
ncbi:hypothetical protein HYV85_01915 [Candidatus Woesearchaeota archaeon]|nr:hypothetical protein [Candidatus Woesearchaeota archaeon]